MGADITWFMWVPKASGAGDGVIRLWQVAGERGAAGRRSLQPLGGLPARGFVNGLQLGRSGQVNCLLLHPHAPSRPVIRVSVVACLLTYFMSTSGLPAHGLRSTAGPQQIGDMLCAVSSEC